jgi:hypothetical protein
MFLNQIAENLKKQQNQSKRSEGERNMVVLKV